MYIRPPKIYIPTAIAAILKNGRPVTLGGKLVETKYLWILYLLSNFTVYGVYGYALIACHKNMSLIFKTLVVYGRNGKKTRGFWNNNNINNKKRKFSNHSDFLAYNLAPGL